MKPGSRPRVLCVDDEPAVLSALRRMARGEPYDLLVTEDPAQALEWVRRGGIDVLVSDQRMPVMTGAELAREVRARSPATKIVFLTAYPDTAVVLQSDRFEVQRLILKPWDDLDLRRTLRRLVGAQGDPSPPGGEDLRNESELQIDCRGLPAKDALAQVLGLLVQSKRLQRPAVLRIENLDRLEGSVSKFLFDLVRLAATWDARITISDRSGFAETLLRLIGGGLPHIDTAFAAGPENRVDLEPRAGI